jgi:hypothetical protein
VGHEKCRKEAEQLSHEIFSHLEHGITKYLARSRENFIKSDDDARERCGPVGGSVGEHFSARAINLSSINVKE